VFCAPSLKAIAHDPALRPSLFQSPHQAPAQYRQFDCARSSLQQFQQTPIRLVTGTAAAAVQHHRFIAQCNRCARINEIAVTDGLGDNQLK
jgi:hypothetical protein